MILKNEQKEARIKMKRIFMIIAVIATALMLINGCAGTKPDQGPEWVWKGSGAFDDESGKVFYGVGSAQGIKNRALLRTTADNRSRAEVAKVLESYVAVLAKDYMASTTAGDMSATSEEQHVEQALKTFSQTTLHGATIVDHWRDPEDGTLFALCKMDLLAFKDALDDYEELDEKVRDYVRSNADKLHTELEELENK
jgi:hypothetical protein